MWAQDVARHTSGVGRGLRAQGVQGRGAGVQGSWQLAGQGRAVGADVIGCLICDLLAGGEDLLVSGAPGALGGSGGCMEHRDVWADPPGVGYRKTRGKRGSHRGGGDQGSRGAAGDGWMAGWLGLWLGIWVYWC